MDFDRIKQNLMNALSQLMALRLIVSSPSKKVADLPAAYVLAAAIMAPWVCAAALVLAAVLVGIGVALGQDNLVLQKAIRICLECVGIG